MRRALFALTLCATPAFADPDPMAAARAQCLAWVNTGYPSGIAEKLCTRDFDLPSAFAVKCDRADAAGNVPAQLAAACAYYRATLAPAAVSF